MNMPRLRGVCRPPLEWAASSSGPKYASVSTMRPRSSVPSSSRRTKICSREEEGGLFPADGPRPGCPSPAWDVPGHPHTAGPAMVTPIPLGRRPWALLSECPVHSQPGPASQGRGALSTSASSRLLSRGPCPPRPVPPDLTLSLGLSGVKGTGSCPGFRGPWSSLPRPTAEGCAQRPPSQL